MKTIDIEQFVNDYLTTASWVECDSDECTDFTKQAKQDAKEDCLKFIDLVISAFGKEKGTELLTIEGNDLCYLAPHDFYLTRNGHGSGFWDKPEYYGIEASEVLSDICKDMKETNVCHVRGKKSKLTFY